MDQRAFSLLLGRADRIARRHTTVLVTGESGAGKEWLARHIHAGSGRAGPFVAVDCTNLHDELLASQLFGHVRGAFTGADYNQLGMVRAASGGTLFLDEIGEISVDMQARFLRMIHERAVQPLGSSEWIPVDIRVISATNRDLWQDVRAGRFREDLYYRINVVELHVPPLRERKDAIPSLAEAFLAEDAELNEEPVKELTAGARDMLLHYDWHGNIRELRNVVEYAAAMARGSQIDEACLPEHVRAWGEGRCARRHAGTLAEAERLHIFDALEQTRGDRTRAAALLGIGRATLYRKLKQWGN